MESGEWLKKALMEVCERMETGLDLDADLISGLVSFCELAPPPDAAEYLMNIIGSEVAQDIIKGYLEIRGYGDSNSSKSEAQTSMFQAYVKPPVDEGLIVGNKKQNRIPKEGSINNNQDHNKILQESSDSRNTHGNSNTTKRKKAGKVISIAEAAKGSVVFQQGKPCTCQARRHQLVSNCLSCGKIVCEQEGEGPCSFCGALVLREGSTYAGLENFSIPISETEATAEAYAKRLVEYDRNSAARTKVIDDQSDYYEIEGNSWLSAQEKELLKKKQKETEEAEEARRGKVIVTFDLVGRKVILNKDEAAEMESEYRILRPAEEREQNRIKPNPTVRVQPVFVNTGPNRKPDKMKLNALTANGFCLEKSGRVQHDSNELGRFVGNYSRNDTSLGLADEAECSVDYN
ncbi:activating signal cointegrator 1 [Phalaenopsis equestris]|uniref:activating signal cointegrator 1 n=1 Tax=Phalaenopsis equestris TaxID=78828 RepID=UPI0009E32E0D|nr:activating signal cointegrator 1 [Phalaenopsis equestris]